MRTLMRSSQPLLIAAVVAMGLSQYASAQCLSHNCNDSHHCDNSHACDCEIASCFHRDETGPYVSLFGGYAGLEDQRSLGLNRNVLADFDGGFTVGAAIGRRLENHWRVEAEFAFRHNEVDDILFLGNPVVDENGAISTYSGLFNLIKDIEIPNKRFRPYIGGGIGFAFVDPNYEYNALPARINGSDSGFAFQGFAGVSTSLSDRMELFVEYRYFGVDAPKLNRFGGSPLDPAGTGAIDVILDSEYNSHGVNFGVRVAGW